MAQRRSASAPRGRFTGAKPRDGGRRCDIWSLRAACHRSCPILRRFLREGDLGDEMRVTVERGARNFASGDRVMFLQNERGLGVKNGTLGTIELVSAQSLTVQTDDGRSVRFDLKD